MTPSSPLADRHPEALVLAWDAQARVPEGPMRVTVRLAPGVAPTSETARRIDAYLARLLPQPGMPRLLVLSPCPCEPAA